MKGLYFCDGTVILPDRTVPRGAVVVADGRIAEVGRAEDIAEAAVFLASDEARYISGVNLPVDGAIHSTLSSPNPMAR